LRRISSKRPTDLILGDLVEEVITEIEMNPNNRRLIIDSLDPKICCVSVSKDLFDIIFQSLMSDINSDKRFNKNQDLRDKWALKCQHQRKAKAIRVTFQILGESLEGVRNQYVQGPMPAISRTLKCKAMFEETIFTHIRADPRGMLALCSMEINPDLFDDPWDQKEVTRKIRVLRTELQEYVRRVDYAAKVVSLVTTQNVLDNNILNVVIHAHIFNTVNFEDNKI
jgi:hypothetical protein